MAQLFRRRSNTIFLAVLFGSLGGVLILTGSLYIYTFSPWHTDVERVVEQPVPFSHKHHVAEVGLDCLYCHNDVEKSAYAGLPATEICMGCHSIIYPDAEILEPIRASFKENKPLEWNRVHALADFVFFDHSIHTQNGIACESCHGRVDRMPLTWKSESLYMRWCLECHRHPVDNLRPKADITKMGWKGITLTEKEKLAESYKIKDNLEDCYACHR